MDTRSSTGSGRGFERREFLRVTGALALGLPFLGAAGAAAAPTRRAAGTVTLQYLNNWGVGNDAHSHVLGQLIDSFQKAHPNIHIDSVSIDESSMITKTRTNCASGHCPDIIHEFDPLYWKSGWVLDLNPYVKGAWKKRFIPETLEFLSFNGHPAALPMEASPMATIWNAKIVKDLGAKIPTTWPELMTLGERAKAKGIYLLSFQLSQMPNDLIWGHPAGPAAMAAGRWNNPAIRYLADRIKEVKDRGFNPPNDASIDFNQAVALFQQRKLVQLSDGAWSIRNYLTPKGKDSFGLAKELEFGTFVRPGVPGGKRAMRVWANGVALAAALKSDPAKLAAGLAFMNYWTSYREASLWLESQSPTGVRVPIPASKYPLLSKFFAARAKAERIYTSSEPLFMRGGIWGHYQPLVSGILTGKSVEDSIRLYVAAQKKAARQFNQGG
jgi:ABC-type glycerol-3-phosphate transport system substrate-binding protein